MGTPQTKTAVPTIFGTGHILYLVTSFALIITALVLITIFCKSDKAKMIAIKVSAAVQLLMIILNNLFVYLWVGHIKLDSLCGTVSFLIAIIALICKKDSSPMHFVAYTALFTGLIPTFYPTYIGQGPTIFFPATITSLIHHSLSFYLAMLIFLLGYVKPNIKKWYAWPLGYFGLVAYGVFNIKFRGLGDSMNINSPIIAGTPFNWFWTALIFICVYTIFLFVYDSIVNKGNCVLVKWWKCISSKFKKKETAPKEEKPSDTDEN